eukprot:scaffold163322_cov23-Tisochrysis_lutea.AAC.2
MSRWWAGVRKMVSSSGIFATPGEWFVVHVSYCQVLGFYGLSWLRNDEGASRSRVGASVSKCMQLNKELSCSMYT